ncbi:hypothetical protein NC653_020874 [Populus alba x Populus x berolinensis]|uniref:Pentatricopeptide repeat-containing protein n=2 Tax=Populus TaxID=3689 RepID=A0A4U5PZC4_POPAL|nr:hypothetical protein NC653_020874 [Populus alba x Populus x berolinensis]TKS03014.1 hypothetical protein D5086_0000158050 [Populus alba]
MGKYGCSPNVTKYNKLLDGLFNANRIQEALRIVGETEEMEIELNLVTYNTILSGFCHAGMLKDALQLVGKMLVGGTKPDAITYNTVIYAYCEQGEVKTAVQLVDRLTEERMMNEGICPNHATWNALDSGLFNKLGHLGPNHIVDDILANGQVP